MPRYSTGDPRKNRHSQILKEVLHSQFVSTVGRSRVNLACPKWRSAVISPSSNERAWSSVSTVAYSRWRDPARLRCTMLGSSTVSLPSAADFGQVCGRSDPTW